MFPVSRSDTNAEPSGRNAKPHGARNPLATVATTCGCTGPVGDGNGAAGEVGVASDAASGAASGVASDAASGVADVAGPADPLFAEDTAGGDKPVAADVPKLPLGAAGCDLEVQPVAIKAATTTVTATGSRLGR